jgi:hypothetical protein
VPAGMRAGALAKYPSDGAINLATPGPLHWPRQAHRRDHTLPRHSHCAAQLVIATCTDYKKAGALLISTDHHGTVDGKPRGISFTKIAVKLTDSDKWVDAQ